MLKGGASWDGTQETDVLEFHALRELNLTTTARVGVSCRVAAHAAPTLGGITGKDGTRRWFGSQYCAPFFELLAGLGHVVGSAFVFLMQLDRGGSTRG